MNALCLIAFFVSDKKHLSRIEVIKYLQLIYEQGWTTFPTNAYDPKSKYYNKKCCIAFIYSFDNIYFYSTQW